MTAQVNFGTIAAKDDDELIQQTVSHLGNIYHARSDTGGLKDQIVAEQLLIECKDRGLLEEAQRRFEERCHTTLQVGSCIPNDQTE